NEKNYSRKEFSFNAFKRVFTLPENVETEKIEALYENGILNLTLPKKELNEDTTTKKVEIK
ncbi:MAG: Hsp20/alpha crystallin family protein, partial [Chitinophagales bacterium]